MSAARTEVLPALSDWSGRPTWVTALDGAADEVDDDKHDGLVPSAQALVLVEQRTLLPWLEQNTSVDDRRRLGTLYRVRRDMVARTPLQRPSLTRTELYERARRAGVENRSRMTQAELAAAVEARERQQASPH